MKESEASPGSLFADYEVAALSGADLSMASGKTDGRPWQVRTVSVWRVPGCLNRLLALKSAGVDVRRCWSGDPRGGQPDMKGAESPCPSGLEV